MPVTHLALGRLIERYQAKPVSGLKWALFLLLLIVPWMAIVAKLWQFLLKDPYRNPLEFLYLNNPLLMIAYLLTFITLTAIIISYWRSKRFIEIYEHGFRWRLWGLKTAAVLWTQFEGIAVARLEYTFFGRTLNQQLLALLYLKDKPPVFIDLDSPKIEKALEELKSQYYGYVFPCLQEKFNQGQSLSFGPICIQRDSLGVFKRLPAVDFFPPSLLRSGKIQKIPWLNLKSISVQNGFLVVQSGNFGTKKIPLSQILNFELLLKIIEQGVT